MAAAFDIRQEDHIAIVVVLESECGSLWSTIQPLLATGLRAVVLDFQSVVYLNSMNIAAVISLRNKLMEKKVGLLLGGVQPNIRSVFRILKLGRLFNLDLAVADAVTAAKTA